MSYEGYVVKYCKNGHHKDVVDAISDMYAPEERKPCEVCGCLEEVHDDVDETNGCMCADITAKDKAKGVLCPAHEKYLKILDYTPVACSNCGGSGKVSVKSFSRKICSACAGKEPACSTCFGTGEETVMHEINNGTKTAPSEKNPGCWTLSEIILEEDCPACQGRGKTFVPRYDVTPLIR